MTLAVRNVQSSVNVRFHDPSTNIKNLADYLNDHKSLDEYVGQRYMNLIFLGIGRF